MHDESFSQSAYYGTKQFSQKEIITANATGFGAAADDYAERGIDLNERLIMNKPATFFFRMNSDAMEAAGIFLGDVLIVDRSIKAASDKIIVAAVNAELVVRYFKKDQASCWLEATNRRYANIELGEFVEYRPWGVVTCVIHLLDPALQAYNTNKKPMQHANDGM